MSKIIKLPGRVESAEVGGIVTGANAIMDDAKGKVQSQINSETNAELLRLKNEKQDNITVDGAPTEGSNNPVASGGVYTAEKALSDAIEAILLLIPSAASALNKLADREFVASSIATSTATFKGTFNLVSDLHLSADATHEQIAGALDSLSLDADMNDYCFVQVPESDTSEDVKVTQRYKFNGTSWAYEYDLNNSGFTAEQWAAINSNITALLVAKLVALPTADALAGLLEGKQDSLTFDDVPEAGSNNPVKSGGVYQRNSEIVALIEALDAEKQDNLTFDQQPVNGSENPVTSGGVYDAIYLVQTVLATLGGNLESVQYSMGLLSEQVCILNTLYQALTQSDIIVGALPASGVANRVYRVPGTSTYADWMWYDGAWVKLAEYTTLDGYLYKGIAVPMGGPSASAVKMFYIAIEPGTYTNFGGLVVTVPFTILKYDGANWSQEQFVEMDAVPTAGSVKPVQSGGVQNELALGAVYDVSAKNPTSGPNNDGKFESLSALLSEANLSTLIPTSVRKGGMSIKFVQISDNKYVQFRYMLDDAATVATFTNVANWQGVDAEPMAGSKNLVESGGAFFEIYSVKALSGKLMPTSYFSKDSTHEIIYSLSNAYRALIANPIKNNKYNLIGVSTLNQTISCRAYRGTLDDYTYVQDITVTNKTIEIGNIDFDFILINQKVAESPNFENCHFECMDDFRIDDTTTIGNQPTKLTLSLKKNENNQEGSAYRTLDTITIEEASDEKVGLMPAKSLWDFIPKKNSNRIVGSGGIYYEIEKNTFKDKIYDATEQDVTLSALNTELIEETIYGDDNGDVKTTTNTSYGTLLFDVSAFDYINVINDGNGLHHNFNGGFFDENKKCLVGFSYLDTAPNNAAHIDVPYKAKYFGVTVLLSNIQYFTYSGYVCQEPYTLDDLNVKFEQVEGCEKEAVKNTVMLGISNTELIEGTLYSDDNGGVKTTTNASYGTLLFDVSAFDYIDISRDPNGLNHNYNGGFFNAQKTCFVGFSNLESTYDVTHINVVQNAKYIGLTVKLSTMQYFSFDGYVVGNSYLKIPNLRVETNQIKSHWYGKKIVWLGTSVPFGQYASESYVKEAADRLGFRLVQTSIPGEAIHGRIDAGTGLIIGAQATPKSGTALTKAEYLAAYNAGLMSTVIADEPIEWVPGGSYNMYYATFENIFTAENADADLYVFDVAPNNTNFDLDDWNAFNKGTFAYNDSSDFSAHRCTFIGALLFLMKKMYDLNPNARCVFVLGCTYNYTEGKAAFETLRAEWKIPIIDLWGKINTCPPSLNVIKSQGGTNWHPSTFAHERMGDMLTNELLLIS